MKVELFDVLRKVMECSNISMKLLSSDENPFLEAGPYSLLYDEHEYAQTLAEWITNIEKSVFYCYQDSYDISYCFVSLPESDGLRGDILVLGPCMEYAMEEDQLSVIMKRNHVPSRYEKELREFYNAIPVIPQIDRWRELCRELFQFFYPEQTMRAEYFLYDFSGYEFRPEEPDNRLSAELIEARYALEEKQMTAIANGDTQSALKYFNEGRKFRISKRYQDSIRDIRNGLIVANTLFRKAAQDGGVHPVHIDALSERIAKRCEKVMTEDEYFSLITEMVRQYCLLVQNYSLSGHSLVIQKAVNYINLNLSEKLSLKLLAEQCFINPSYLSTLFKKEMGLTVSSYISQQRIRLAIRLLNTGNTQIQDVMAKCGMDDISYFRKLFKKMIGMTPSAYVTLVHGSKRPLP